MSRPCSFFFFLEGLSAATASLEPNSLLYVPPGYFVCYLTKKSKLHVQARVPLTVRHDGLNAHVGAMHAVLSNSTQHVPSQRDAQILASLMDSSLEAAILLRAWRGSHCLEWGNWQWRGSHSAEWAKKAMRTALASVQATPGAAPLLA